MSPFVSRAIETAIEAVLLGGDCIFWPLFSYWANRYRPCRRSRAGLHACFSREKGGGRNDGVRKGLFWEDEVVAVGIVHH